MRTLGVDLAASPTNTAACLIEWDSGTVTLLDGPVDDAAIVDAAAAVDMVGIDIPLGWPDRFVDAIVAHHSRGGWPPVTIEPPDDRVELRFRRTDRALMQAGFRPLSVSTDRIGVAAMRGARLLELFRQEGLPIDRSGMSGVVAEVYPAAALKVWGLTHTGYKGRRNRDVCDALVSSFSDICGPLADTILDRLSEADDHALDAVVCAFLAKAVRDGATGHPTPDDMDAARREGWIHVPTVGPGEIAGSC